MMEHFVPDDDELQDREHHTLTSQQAEEPTNYTDDQEFSQTEIPDILKGFNPKKATGEYGLTSHIIFRAYK